MPARTDPWPAGTPCWVDISVDDVAAATAFYGAVLPWSFVDTGEEFGHYHIARIGGDRAAAAIGPKQDPSQPGTWTVYFASDDADTTAKAVAEHGGTVLAEPFDVPGNGRMTIAVDPTGAPFGVWQAGGTIGCEAYMEPGTFAWTDERTPDPDAARAFYGAVFGHSFQPMEGAPEDYTTIHFDGARDREPVGGIGGFMGAPEGTAPHWLPYFSVPDADVSAAAARAGGGQVLGEPFDTPFGRMTFLVDPWGAPFSVVGAAPS